MTEQVQTEAVNQAEQPVSQETTNVEPSNITLQDLTLCVNVIDVMSQRGAVKGDELELIGTLRRKLVTFIKANAPPEEVTEGDEETAEE